MVQLDRSVLEKKDRTELFALAGDMELKPSTRTKKSDLVDLIITASEFVNKGSSNTNGSDVSKGANLSENGAAAAPKVARSRAKQTESNGSSEVSMPAAEQPSQVSQPKESQAKIASQRPSGPRVITSSTSRLFSSVEEASSTEVTGLRPAPEVRKSQPAESEVAKSRQDGTPQTSTLFPPITVVPKARTNGDADGPSGEQQPRRSEFSDQSDQSSRRNSRRRRGRERGPERNERGEREGSEAQAQVSSNVELSDITGVLDLRDEGFGFIRANGYLPSTRDVYVPISTVRRYGMRRGDIVSGGARPANNNEKYSALVRVDLISGNDPEIAKLRPRFEDLTPLFPDEKLRLELPGDPANLTGRIIDLISPIGKGQRGLIVSPSKAGKTTIMKQIAHCIEQNNPEVSVIMLLVDERPEEVTDIRRSVKGDVIASTFDRPADEHTAVAELTIERAKRMVEGGQDVVIILDGITRLARAYNLAQPATGRIMSGGVDSGALYPPKKFFGAARNVEEGGSLTILATALVESGSKMDEVIFEEFKGTGNMELRLDRKLAERRLYPAIDVSASSTRHEELLFTKDQLSQIWKLRRVLSALAQEGSSAPGLELLIDKIRNTRSNAEFLAEIAKSPMI